MLELEKQRIEQNSDLLKQERDKESVEWKSRVAVMQQQHDRVVQNLDSVNNQYQQQVEENESLKMQLDQMKQQHAEMMSRFEQIEQKINSQNQGSNYRSPEQVGRSDALMLS